MPEGKPAGVRCAQLDAANHCLLFGSPQRPRVCVSLRPAIEMCGVSNDEAFAILIRLEATTKPVGRDPQTEETEMPF